MAELGIRARGCVAELTQGRGGQGWQKTPEACRRERPVRRADGRGMEVSWWQILRKRLKRGCRGCCVTPGEGTKILNTKPDPTTPCTCRVKQIPHKPGPQRPVFKLKGNGVHMKYGSKVGVLETHSESPGGDKVEGTEQKYWQRGRIRCIVSTSKNLPINY